MKMPDVKRDEESWEMGEPRPLEIAPDGALDLAEARPGWAPSLGVWDVFVGYWASPMPARYVPLDLTPARRFDEEDFSAEHGYEPGCEGRSEFEHGEFDRWI